MFPPIVSASPPPSDDEQSGDEGDDLGVADSSFDITGLSQKLSACQVQKQKPAPAVSGRTYSPGAAEPAVTAASGRRPSSDEWDDFHGAPPPPPPELPAQVASAEPDAASSRENPPAVPAAPTPSEVAPGDRVTEDRTQERSIFTDSDSDSEGVDRRKVHVASPPTKDSVGLQKQSGGIETADGVGSLKEMENCNRDSRPVTDKVTVYENGTVESPRVPEVGGDSDSDDFGDFGSFSAAPAALDSDQFGGWSEPVTSHNAATELTSHHAAEDQSSARDTVTKQSQARDSPVSVSDQETDSRSVAVAESCNGLIEPASRDSPVSADDPPRDSDPSASMTANGLELEVTSGEGFVSSELEVTSSAGPGISECGSDRVPSPGVAAAEPPSSAELAEDAVNSPVETAPVDSELETATKAVPPGEPADTPSSLEGSPERALSPEDPETRTKPEEIAGDDAPADDFGDFAAPSDDFGDFSAPTGDFPAPSGDFAVPNEDFPAPPGDFSAPTDEFGDFSGPADDFGDFETPTEAFGDFSAPAASSGDVWPPDGTTDDGGGGFADFGAVFTAPPDTGAVAPPLETEHQLADPAALDDDDFGDFEDFHAPEPPKETTPVSDEAAVSALLSRLFPPVVEDREPACVPLDAGGVWYQLRESDTTPALQYRWSGCRAYTALLHALRVDASNIINFGGWGGRPGRFAYALDSGPIQPVKATPEHVPPDQSQQQQPAVNEVPPAAFDWNGAGLKNPLDASGLERELLASEDPPTSTPAASGTSSVFSRLMAQAAGPSLSEAASAVVDRIPDIDFMRAKVLMFPVRGGE